MRSRRPKLKKTSYKILVPLFVALAALFFKGQPVDYTRVLVRTVVDGDTVELSNGKPLRYIGIDCPETHRKTEAGWRDVVEPFGQEARQLNVGLVLGKSVRLEFDVQKQDKYQRLLAYCFVQEGGREVMVQEELLRQGLAYLYTFSPNIKYVDRLVAALNEAKRKRVGLWSIDLSLDSQEAGAHIGERKTVTGLIKRVRQSAKVIRLETDGIVFVIFKNDLGLFEREGIDPPVFYKARNVRVFGLIKEYNGKPEIIVSNPWQIEVQS
ncbi:MAG: thermonuclease family protein [Candidatus Omnitrophota bacterium]